MDQLQELDKGFCLYNQLKKQLPAKAKYGFSSWHGFLWWLTLRTAIKANQWKGGRLLPPLKCVLTCLSCTFIEQISLFLIFRQCEIKHNSLSGKFSKVRLFYEEVNVHGFSLIFSYRKCCTLFYSLVSKATFGWQIINISVWEFGWSCDTNTPIKT